MENVYISFTSCSPTLRNCNTQLTSCPQISQEKFAGGSLVASTGSSHRLHIEAWCLGTSCRSPPGTICWERSLPLICWPAVREWVESNGEQVNIERDSPSPLTSIAGHFLGLFVERGECPLFGYQQSESEWNGIQWGTGKYKSGFRTPLTSISGHLLGLFSGRGPYFANQQLESEQDSMRNNQL